MPGLPVGGFNCKVQISDQEGLEPLIQLLSIPDPDVKRNSEESIYNLVQVCVLCV